MYSPAHFVLNFNYHYYGPDCNILTLLIAASDMPAAETHRLILFVKQFGWEGCTPTTVCPNWSLILQIFLPLAQALSMAHWTESFCIISEATLTSNHSYIHNICLLVGLQGWNSSEKSQHEKQHLSLVGSISWVWPGSVIKGVCLIRRKSSNSAHKEKTERKEHHSYLCNNPHTPSNDCSLRLSPTHPSKTRSNKHLSRQVFCLQIATTCIQHCELHTT